MAQHSEQAKLTMRVIACAQLALVAVGVYWLTVPWRAMMQDRSLIPPWPYWIMTAINLLFLVLLVWAAVLLWKRSELGLKLSLATFVCEIGYLLFPLELIDRTLGVQFGEWFGVANMGLGPQVMTGYPLFAGIIVGVLLFKSKRRRLVTA